MALELRFVGGDVLDPDAEIIALRGDDAIDLQERVAVREKTQQPLDIVAFQSLTRRYVHSLALDL
jgi:hypothetical protein